ncbi:MAG: TerB family tellurite resistance protein [Alphaproteobacteria bacterium]|nr:TerB family tellurite resistance protein [Alphaproteobacteria bacterium]
MTEQISESRFNMWRAIFAMAWADSVITEDEEKFMRDAIERYPFTEDQREVLELDMTKEQHVGTCFSHITEQQDRSDFFVFARLLVWCDGDFDEQEQYIMTELKKVHISSLDFETMVKDVSLSFEDDEKEAMKKNMRAMYAELQKESKDSSGGFFGGVIRKMWKS